MKPAAKAGLMRSKSVLSHAATAKGTVPREICDKTGNADPARNQ
jgi:hypothetical protein